MSHLQIGFDKDGKINAADFLLYANAGCSNDYSTFVSNLFRLLRNVFHLKFSSSVKKCFQLYFSSFEYFQWLFSLRFFDKVTLYNFTSDLSKSLGVVLCPFNNFWLFPCLSGVIQAVRFLINAFFFDSDSE